MSSNSPSGIIPSPTTINPFQEIFDYVMNSPENTNPNVLKSLLEKLGEGILINEPIANAFLVTIVNIDNTFTSTVTYDQLEEASLQNIPILFLSDGKIGIASKANNSYSSQIAGSTFAFYPDNTILIVENTGK